MDQEIRNKLRNVVTQCRKLLEDSISQELEGKYGIFAKKDQVTADPNAKMAHLSDEEQAARKDILDHLGHITARGFKPKESLDQLIREIAFTHLNRLCAYKMMEAREVYVGGQKFREAVSRGVNSNGVKFYLAEHEDDERLFNTGQQDVAYRHYLDWLGGALSDEIGVLFNPNDPANRLYPRQKTLDEVLELLNEGGIKAEETELREQWPKIWSQDETIGWVYQYFTPKELRDQARKESQAPRNSYELAFRNQFFTPRYVVEFLTDNTLGRIWYEMRKGETKLKDQCRYMVRRPTEIFLKEGEQPPKDTAEGKDDLSQEELLKLPVHIPHRPKKDPRELKILDPACGSGHFLLYCFDLLLTIYEEAYADHDLGPALQKDYPKLDDLRRDVPRLILAHNLHGIDIDLRASQIAALALWLRCQRAYQEMGLKKDRPKITRSNFVCAEPMPGEEQMLKEFVAQLEPKVLGQVVEVVFDKMKLAGEAGSLLKIEEEIRDAVAAAKKQYVRETTQATDRKGQPLLFTQAAMDRLAGKPEQPSLFDLSDITDDQFFEQAEGRVIETLRSYAEKAQNGQRLQRRLFADDAQRGFAFIDVCQKRYDVALMNPPFGAEQAQATSVIERYWPNGRHDLATAFVDQANSRLASGGSVGIIMTRSPFYRSRFNSWRHELLFGNGPHINLFVDLGQGVLDTAMIETAAIVIGRGTSLPTAIDLREINKDTVTPKQFAELQRYVFASDVLNCVPNSPIAYWVPRSTLLKFKELGLFGQVAEVRQGLATKNNERFVRAWWEVSNRSLTNRGPWRTFAKGGEYAQFYLPLLLVIDWSDAAQELYRDRDGQMVVLLTKSKDKYLGRPANTYSKRSQIGFSSRVLHRDTIFSPNGPGVFSKDDTSVLFDLGFLNSSFSRACIDFLTSFGFYSEGYVESLAYPVRKQSGRREVSEAVRVCVENAREQFISNEITREYCFPPLDSTLSLRENATKRAEKRQHHGHLLAEQASVIDELMTECLGLNELDRTFARSRSHSAKQSDGDDDLDFIEEENAGQTVRSCLSYLAGAVYGRWDIRIVTGLKPLPKRPDPFDPLPTCPVGMLQGDDGLPTEVAPKDYPLRIDSDGILPDDADHPDDIARRVRDVLEVIWKHRADAIEKEACEILGVKELRDYFRKPSKGGFWDDHISRYSKSRRKAPIYWLLQSSKKNYAIWLYYHRLDKDLLFKALVNYVEPKIRLETSRLESLRSQKAAVGESGKEAKRLAKEVERQEDFLSELRDFEDKLRRAANLHLEPDLNDGVVLNIAPLHELVPWKEAKKYWDELLKGEYEWSSIGRQLRQKGLVK